MPKKKFEHQITYIPLPYEVMEKGKWIFKSSQGTTRPDIQRFLQSGPDVRTLYLDMGNDGWELVAVESLLEPMTDEQKAKAGHMFALPVGFIFFWKREVEGGINEPVASDRSG